MAAQLVTIVLFIMAVVIVMVFIIMGVVNEKESFTCLEPFGIAKVVIIKKKMWATFTNLVDNYAKEALNHLSKVYFMA